MLPPLTIFDVETTGLEPRQGHRIIEIAAMRMENGRIASESPYHSLVNPERPVPPEIRQFNGIDPQELLGAPTIMEVLPAFLRFAEGSILVAHNANFDMGFLKREKEFCWGFIDLPECLCTLSLSRNLFPMHQYHNLDAVCDRLQIPRPPQRHRALPDVLLTAQALLRLLDAGRIRSLEELRRRASLAAPSPARSR